jgi:uncharacterized protein (TIGR03437 family)
MTQKYISVLTLAFAGAVTGFAQITLNSVPSRSIGSPALNITSLNPNLVDGREFYSPQSVAVDTSVSPPILYVSDTQNNRVLAWKNANSFQSGQKADLAIGQPDLLTTFPGGPATAYSTGLYQPTGVAAYKGDLYVADSGNNRVLRYPNPFNQVTQQQKQFPTPDLWIGQATLSTRVVNYTGQATPNAQGVFLTNGTAVLQSSIAFDSQGNLWMSDAGNLRVLRFKAGDVASGGGGLTADLELGQNDFVSLQTQLSTSNATAKYITNQFFLPDALAFDPSGNLFVTDFTTTFSRVMVFTPPFTTGMSASPHIMEVFPATFVFPTDLTVYQALLDKTVMSSPEGVFFLTGSTPAVGVVDSGSSRILLFDTFANWPTDGTPPQAKSIYGQPNTTCPAQQTGLPTYAACRYPNNGLPRPAANTLYGPGGAFATSTDLFVADSGNNRVVDLPISGNTLTSATRVLGQDRNDTNSINLIEGREFQFGNVIGTDSAIAIDATGSVPHLYISDPGNNRVLGFKDLRNLKPGARADIVLGQPDMQSALVNYPANDGSKPNSSGLYRPIGLLVDSHGNLYVADSLNGRVLRFPAPFAYTGSANPEAADLVLGQQNFTTKIPDPTSSTMAAPYGLAFSGVNGLVVSDQGDDRVLYIPMTNGTFAAGSDNGKAATIVFGQQGFNGKATGSDLTGMNNPHGVSCDSNGYVYVADSGNNRILIFNDPHSSSTQSGEAAATFIGSLSDPQSVFVNLQTGEIWVANTNGGVSLRYANYNSVLLGNGSISGIQEVSSYNGSNIGLHPLAVAQDQYGALYVADDANRVAFYFPGLNACNGATFMAAFASKAPNLCAPFDSSSNNTLNAHPLAPGVLGTLFPCANCAGDQFGDVTGAFNGTYPMQTTLNDVQVFVDGVATPLYYVGAPIPPDHPSGQINFVVPNTARTVGNADVEVVRFSTGQVLGATLVPMAAASPGILVCQNFTGTYRGACVINQDNTVNGPSNPAPRGSVMSIYATGQGFVPNAPSDGSSPGALPSPAALTVVINAVDVNGYTGEASQHIQYSGLDQFPGVWQINVLIPQGVAPSSVTTTLLNIIVNGTANIDLGLGWKTVIWVK